MSSEEKVLVPRRFRLAGASGQSGGDPLSWSELADYPAIVVLGEPGAGKSTEFEREAARTGGAFLSIREFLAGLVPQGGSGPLFLDGLDEARASDSDRSSVLLKIAAKLRELGRPQVRLSCRAADWFGELDQGDLARAYATEQIWVVELQPLRERDVKEIVLAADLGDSAAFLETVRRQGMEDWLGNPQTLELMIAVARKGSLPATKSELFEKACLLMAGEENARHRHAQPVRVSPEKILEAAGFLCALVLIAGLGGFAGDRSEAGEGFPALDEISGAPGELRAAVESRLFRWEDGRAVPIHRTVAEFLAARFLRDRIAGGLPLERVLRLITGQDGGTLSDLRGLFAWLTSLLPGHAEALARRDPAAVIFYGDPAQLPSLVKRAVLAGLERLADRYPWFFYEGRSQSFGALADPALIPDFRTALADPARPRYYRLAVLAILAYGRVLPDLREDLRSLVYDKETPQGLRELALKALIHETSNKSELLAILEDVQEKVLNDNEDSMRAALLESLYPEVLKPGVLVRYLTVPKDLHHYGDYYRFVRKGLSSRTADDLVPDLLDALSDLRIWSGHRKKGGWLRGTWSELAGNLLGRGLEIYGDGASVARLWSWLKVGRDHGVLPVLEKEGQAAVRDWFNARPQRIVELYRWWVLEGSVAEGGSSSLWFWSALCYPVVPPDLWQRELSMAASWGRGERAEALLRSVVNRLYHGAARPTLDELFEWAEQHPAFREPLDNLLHTHLPQHFHDPKGEEHDRIEAEKEAAIQAGNLAYIRERIELVRAGEEREILDFLADRFLDLRDRSNDLKGLSGIREEFDEEVERAASEGFLSLLERSDWPSSEEIGELSVRGGLFTGGRALLVGALLAQERGTPPKLSESSGLRAALAFEFVEGEYEPSHWYVSVLEAEPAIAADIVDAVWRPALKTQPKSLVHLFKMDEEAGLKLIAGRIGLRLLEDHPQAHPELLEQLMRAALAGASKADLTALVDREVQPQDLPEDRRELWFALGAIVDLEESTARLAAYLQGDGASERAHRLVQRLKYLDGVGGWSIFASSSSALADLFKLLAALVPPPSLPSGGTLGDYDRSQLVARFATELGNRLDDESMARLGALRDEPALSAWRERLAEMVEQQSRKVRESRYQKPSLENALKVLTAGEPTDPGDLHAIVCDHLRRLIEEIEHGAGSGFRTFWNVWGKGDPLQSPVTENEARSRLRDRLNERLAPRGITAEIEGNYSGGKRGDLKVIYRSMNVPIEVKRHYNEEVWEAPKTQLKEKYAIDPGSGGYGIYLVFWFGEDKGRRVPVPPAGIARPTTAAEMETALRQMYSGDEWNRIEFFCVDCSKR
jgi:hypothetical protein